MRSTRRAAWLPLLLALAAAPAFAAEKLAVFDAELFDTSGQGEQAEQQRRLVMIGEELRQALAASGRYTLVDVAPQRARLRRRAGAAQLRRLRGRGGAGARRRTRHGHPSCRR